MVKISDFGLAKYVEYKNYYKNEKGGPLPIKWLALESLDSGVYTCQSDVWSYAVVLWEIFSLGDAPYPGIELSDLRNQVLNQGLRLSRPEHALDPVYQIMQACQHEEPSERPTFSTLKSIFQKIASDYTLGLVQNSNPNSPEPRSQFANSLYFSAPTSDYFLSNDLPESTDGYLLPSPAKPRPHSYLQMVTSAE